jgi:hypothetical protein
MTLSSVEKFYAHLFVFYFDVDLFFSGLFVSLKVVISGLCFVVSIRMRSKTLGRCDQSPIKRTKVPYYDKNGAWKATVFATPESEDSSPIIIAFNESTGDLITGDK